VRKGGKRSLPFSLATWGLGGRAFKSSSLRWSCDEAVILGMMAYTSFLSGTERGINKCFCQDTDIMKLSHMQGGDMREKYRGLVVASVLLRVAAVVVMVVGVGLCLWYLVGSERSELSRIVTILGICGSLLVGIIAYSLGEVIGLLLDKRYEVRDKNSEKQ
jgi:hypothetical protein